MNPNPPFSVSDSDAQRQFSELLARVEAGSEVTITRRGAPIAKLAPMRRQTTPEERRAAIERWVQSAAGLSLGGLKLKDLIAEGRK